jgi:hypothetical protein
MANKKVVVHGRTIFFHEIMDESAVAAYVTAASGAGFYTSPDGDLIIPFPIAEVAVQDVEFTQATRQDAGNFGPDQVNPINEE